MTFKTLMAIAALTAFGAGCAKMSSELNTIAPEMAGAEMAKEEMTAEVAPLAMPDDAMASETMTVEAAAAPQASLPATLEIGELTGEPLSVAPIYEIEGEFEPQGYIPQVSAYTLKPQTDNAQ